MKQGLPRLLFSLIFAAFSLGKAEGCASMPEARATAPPPLRVRDWSMQVAESEGGRTWVVAIEVRRNQSAVSLANGFLRWTLRDRAGGKFSRSGVSRVVPPDGDDRHRFALPRDVAIDATRSGWGEFSLELQGVPSEDPERFTPELLQEIAPSLNFSIPRYTPPAPSPLGPLLVHHWEMEDRDTEIGRTWVATIEVRRNGAPIPLPTDFISWSIRAREQPGRFVRSGVSRPELLAGAGRFRITFPRDIALQTTQSGAENFLLELRGVSEEDPDLSPSDSFQEITPPLRFSIPRYVPPTPPPPTKPPTSVTPPPPPPPPPPPAPARPRPAPADKPKPKQPQVFRDLQATATCRGAVGKERGVEIEAEIRFSGLADSGDGAGFVGFAGSLPIEGARWRIRRQHDGKIVREGEVAREQIQSRDGGFVLLTVYLDEELVHRMWIFNDPMFLLEIEVKRPKVSFAPGSLPEDFMSTGDARCPIMRDSLERPSGR